MVCWKCKGNHYPRKCPQLQNRCFYCGETGHIVANCPKKTSVTCFICKKEGHISTTCPQRSKNVKTQVPKVVSGTKEKKNNDDQGAKTGGSGKVFARPEVFTVKESDNEEKAKGPTW